MAQGEECLTVGGQPTPSGPELPLSGSESSRQAPQGCDWTDRSTTEDKHARLPVATGDLGREPDYQELRRSTVPICPTPGQHRQTGKTQSQVNLNDIDS